MIKKIKSELVFYNLLATDPRTPFVSRWLLAAAVGYLLMPFDLIPDFIPVFGHLDDLLIVPLLVWLAFKFIPPTLQNEIRIKSVQAH